MVGMNGTIYVIGTEASLDVDVEHSSGPACRFSVETFGATRFAGRIWATFVLRRGAMMGKRFDS